jgi:uncharacterized membrane protein YoaK (UPF0700 family)
MNNIAIYALTIFVIVVLAGIFCTKTKGFGKYTTSLLLLIIVLFLSSFFLLLGKISPEIFANVLFATAGFGGGLLNAKKLNEK